MNKRDLIIFSLLLVIGLLLVGCYSSAPEPTDLPDELLPAATATVELTSVPTDVPEPITLTDGLDQKIVLLKPAQKIISLSPSTTEILFAIGAGELVIGRDSNSIFPEEALAILDLGGMWDGVPAEDILALEPDLVVAAAIIPPDNIQQLRDLGLTVYWQANPVDFEALYNNMLDFALMTGTLEDTEYLIDSLQDRVSTIDDALIGIENIPLVFYELDATDPTNPWTTGAGTFISYIIQQAKGKNLGDVLVGDWAQISSEELLVQNPDLILLADAMYGVTVESVSARPGWDEIKAVVDGQLYPFDPNILSVPGPRLVDGLEAVAKILHPQFVENID